MNDIEFFRKYIPALKKALSNDNQGENFEIDTPDWYVKDESLRNRMDVFEEENFDKFSSIFQMVTNYFHAKAHYFEKINDVTIENYKKELELEIDKYCEQYGIDITPR